MSINPIDLEIITLLQENSRLSYKEIGEKIHLTGQAVGVRITKLIEEGIIKKFTVSVNQEKLGLPITALIKIYMKTLDHNKIKHLIENTDMITEAYRTSSDCCYFMKVVTGSSDELNLLLDKINEFATYQLTLSIGKLK